MNKIQEFTWEEKQKLPRLFCCNCSRVIFVDEPAYMLKDLVVFCNECVDISFSEFKRKMQWKWNIYQDGSTYKDLKNIYKITDMSLEELEKYMEKYYE